MRSDDQARLLTALGSARSDLNRLAGSSEADIHSVGLAFKGLAAQADTILKQAGAIVVCVQNENVSNVLDRVQGLCVTVRAFLQQRLEAADKILFMLKNEEKLLGHLTRVRHRQEAVAAHLKALSVLTDVEVTQLGSVGRDFEVLAGELSQFSKSVFEQTQELANRTENCARTIAETRRALAANLPQLRREMNRMEEDIAQSLRAIDTDLTQLAEVPGRFRLCAEQTTQQIAGVIAAIQSHDITRQQIEHVQEALQLIESRMSASEEEQSAHDLALTCAGLNIQVCQLKNIKQTVERWTSQIGRCMADIQQLGTSELVGIGPLVLNQERELSSQLAHIEVLQQKSQDYSGRIQNTLKGLSSLLKLVNEHMERSESIRHLLQLLTFNSLVEAHRLGRRGAVVSAIANLIKGVSAEWNAIAEQSGLALAEIMKLVTETNQVMEVFSEVNAQKMREDQAETRAALDIVRDAAEFVAKEAVRMQAVTQTMHSDLATAGNPADRLGRCFRDLDHALNEIEGLALELRRDSSEMDERCDAAEAERLFGKGYTTEIERHVMHAALNGTPLPMLEQSFAGNTVELF